MVANRRIVSGVVLAAVIPAGAWAAWDRERLAKTGGSAQQYKHPCLVGDLGFRETMTVLREVGYSAVAG